jgi:hypothetical protein
MSSQTELSPSTLSAYLNDHLAGSKAGIELAQSCRADHEGTPLGNVMDRLVTEIDEDRNTLEDLMSRLGIEHSRVKQAGGWVMEKLSRIRFAEHVTGSEATSRLMQLETLSLGIEGKHLLWKALRELGRDQPGLQGIDFDRLVSRAEAQRESIEPFRLEAAAEGLTA